MIVISLEPVIVLLHTDAGMEADHETITLMRHLYLSAYRLFISFRTQGIYRGAIALCFGTVGQVKDLGHFQLRMIFTSIEYLELKECLQSMNGFEATELHQLIIKSWRGKTAVEWVVWLRGRTGYPGERSVALGLS